MKRHTPRSMYRRRPCSMVAVGCALKCADENALKALKSPLLRPDGYLSLDGMNRLIRGNLSVKKRVNFKRGQRPILRDFCHGFSGKAIVCVSGHYVYVEGGDYWSYFWNGEDEVISVWVIE